MSKIQNTEFEQMNHKPKNRANRLKQSTFLGPGAHFSHCSLPIVYRPGDSSDVVFGMCLSASDRPGSRALMHIGGPTHG